MSLPWGSTSFMHIWSLQLISVLKRETAPGAGAGLQDQSRSRKAAPGPHPCGALRVFQRGHAGSRLQTPHSASPRRELLLRHPPDPPRLQISSPAAPIAFGLSMSIRCGAGSALAFGGSASDPQRPEAGRSAGSFANVSCREPQRNGLKSKCAQFYSLRDGKGGGITYGFTPVTRL